jgi:UDP-GlcNAc:undecaprenyl-phosphate GlcNAc-1-phosphate transferase
LESRARAASRPLDAAAPAVNGVPGISLASAFALASLFSLALVPLAVRLAWATGWLDHPAARKLHISATPVLGGAVVLAATSLAVTTVTLLGIAPRNDPLPWPILAGGVAVFGLGLWDDRFGLGPLPKLLVQGGAAATVAATLGVPSFGLPPLLELAACVVALVALMNAINFLDNMNGMVGGISAITFTAFALTSWGSGRPELAVIQLALAGATAGFLPHNFPKARIFLGDAGSLFLGYSLGASALLAEHGAPGGWGRLGLLLLLAYPAFDMIFVVVCRVREGRRVDQGGRDHTNHRLASLIQCPKRTVLLIWSATAALCVSGLAALLLNHPLPALLLWGLWTLLFLLMGRRLSSVPLSPPAR